MWAITSDACSFFSTYTEKNDIQKGENYPQSGLATIQSLVGMNSVIQVMDTPAQWLQQRKPTLRPSDLYRASGGLGSDTPPGSSGASGGRIKRKFGTNDGAADTQFNKDMHQVLLRLMKPVFERKLHWSLGSLVRRSGLSHITDIPKHPKHEEVCF